MGKLVFIIGAIVCLIYGVVIYLSTEGYIELKEDKKCSPEELQKRHKVGRILGPVLAFLGFGGLLLQVYLIFF